MLSEADAGPNQASVVDGPLELFKLLAPDLAVPSKKKAGLLSAVLSVQARM